MFSEQLKRGFILIYYLLQNIFYLFYETALQQDLGGHRKLR